MKKILFIAFLLITSLGVFAQKGEFSLLGNFCYQTDFKRVMLGAQGRYKLTDHVRLAPDLMFFFPKDKTTGLDVDVNAHYVFNLKEDHLSLYPLAGFNLQNNFQGKRTVKGEDGEVTLDSHSSTNFGFNVGGGLTYNLNPRNFLNVEYKYVFGKDNSSVIAFGWGYRF